MTPRRVDVAVVGGGPGVSAAALSLRAHAPALSVALLEATRYEATRLGETLPPPARRLLEHLGAWDAFLAQGHGESHGTAAAWGAPTPRDNDFVFSARGVGWHLDRAAFDAMLAGRAEAAGAVVLRGARLAAAARSGREW
ncbi:MAG TPA: monooxygenase, partial [Longimicrobiaceae bacterium]|nr:monooxygenase [Longimicrobiaceae bacterium]